MNRWLEKIQKAPAPTPRKPPKSPSRALRGEEEARFPENHPTVEQTNGGHPPPTTPKSTSRALRGEGEARFPENHAALESADVHADHDTAIIIANLTHDYTGRPLHDLGAEVVAALEFTLPMLRRPARGHLAAQIDDAFRLAPSVEEARQRALRLLAPAP